MGWRYLYIKNCDKLSLDLDSLAIDFNNKRTKIPLNDIHTIMVEDYKATLTSRLLSRLSDYKILLLICDVNMMPTAILNSFSGHHHGAYIVNKQIHLSNDLKGRIWKVIIENKILNQYTIAYKNNLCSSNSILINFANSVNINDSTNREGVAAREYFKCIFGDKFSRNDSINNYNNYLNYGYSIIRSCFCRDIAANGLIPSIGIFHRNEFNNFNLADDLMEVYRPLIDNWVLNNADINIFLNTDIKKE